MAKTVLNRNRHGRKSLPFQVSQIYCNTNTSQLEKSVTNNSMNISLVLKGILTEETIKHLQLKKKIIVFVSSTFTDTFKERNVVQERILPVIQQVGKENEIQILFYDMRFDDRTYIRRIISIMESGWFSNCLRIG